MSGSSALDTNSALQNLIDSKSGSEKVALLKDMLRRQRKRNPSLWLQLAQAYLQRRYSAKALKCATEAVRRAPKNPVVLSGASSILLDLGEADRAQAMLDQARATAPDSPQIALQKANIHERGHELEEAFDEVKSALAAAPDSQRGLMMKGKILRRQKEYDGAENVLQDLVRADPTDLMAHLEGGYELARVYEAQGGYARAMEVFAETKDRMRETMADQVTRQKAARNNWWLRSERFLKSMIKDHVNNWIQGDCGEKPMALGVLGGHPRSGTTLLEQVLDSHPQLQSADETVVMAEQVIPHLQKVLGTADKDGVLALERWETIRPATLAGLRRAYKRHSIEATGVSLQGTFLLDKNPALTPSLPHILKAFPETKLIVALRDPRNVCVSCYQLWVGLNTWSVSWLSLEETVENYARAMSVWKHLRELLPEDHWIEVKYEDVVDDLESEGKRATRFLNLEWSDKQALFYEHASQKRVKSPTYAAVTQGVYRTALDRWRNYEEHVAPLKDKLEPWLTTFGYDW